MNKKAVFRIILAVAVLAVALWWVFRSIDLSVVSEILGRVDVAFVAAAIPIVIASHFVRAIRWRRMLAHLPTKLSVLSGFSAIMIGYAVSMVVPRSGEVVRPFVAAQRARQSFPVLLGSVVLERVIDVLTLLVGIATLIIARNDLVAAALPGITTTEIIGTIALPLILLASLLIVISFTQFGNVVINKLVRPVSLKLAKAMDKILADVKLGTESLKTTKQWALIVLDSVVMWTLYAVPLWFVLHAMPWNGPHFVLADAAVLLVIVSIGVTVAPTPGALGVYQGFAQTALVRLYGASPDEGFVFGILGWILNYGVALIVGGICFLLEMQKGLRLRNVPPTP